jgi:DNA-directed RNA polymerase subunit RPC12/RpoP
VGNMKKALANIISDKDFTTDEPSRWIIKCTNKECNHYIEIGPSVYDEHSYIMVKEEMIILDKDAKNSMIAKTIGFLWPGSIKDGTTYICKDCLKTSFIDNDERFECEHCKKRNLVTGDYSVGKLCPKCNKGKFIKDALMEDGKFFGTDYIYDPEHVFNCFPNRDNK